MGKKKIEKEPVTLENLKAAIKRYDRGQVLLQLQGNVLDQASAEEREDILNQLFILRDMQIVDYLAKELGEFTPEMFQMDHANMSNRNFLNEVLHKYKKKFDWDNDNVCAAMFPILCKISCVEILRMLLKQKKLQDKYALIASAQEDTVFELLLKLDAMSLSEDQVVDILLGAATSKNPEERLAALDKAGYSVGTVNSSDQDICTVLSNVIKSGNYPSNKNGTLMKNKNRNTLQFLQKYKAEKENPQEKEKDKVSPKYVILTIILLLLLFGGTYVIAKDILTDSGSSSTSSSSTSSSDASSDSSASSSESDSDDASTSGTLSTDTSLTVADGDTVNIDYTGYVDGTAFDGGSTDGAGADLIIGSGSYIDDFEDQLIGHKVGDQVEVKVTFPDDYGTESLNGKDATFDVTINGIYE